MATCAGKSAVTISWGTTYVVTYVVKYAVTCRVSSKLTLIVIVIEIVMVIDVLYVLVTCCVLAVLSAMWIVLSPVMPSESLRSALVGGATYMRLRLCNVPF